MMTGGANKFRIDFIANRGMAQITDTSIAGCQSGPGKRMQTRK
jgi:hypothetical protein